MQTHISGFRQWWITDTEIEFVLKEIPEVRNQSVLNHHYLYPGHDFLIVL